MAESGEKVIPNPGGSEKKLQLDQLSHEDLVKQCKRQLMFLQKAKAKSDDLSRRVTDLENENKKLKETSPVSDESVVQLEEYQILKSKHDLAQEELVTEKEERRKFEHKERDVSEQLQCTIMKLSTLEQTCQYLQGELKSVEETRKDTSQQMEVLIQARDAALESLKSSKEHWKKERSALELDLEEYRTSQSSLEEESNLFKTKIHELEQLLRTLEEQQVKESSTLDAVREENVQCVSKIDELEKLLHSLDEDRNKECIFLNNVKEENLVYVAKINDLEQILHSLDEDRNKERISLSSVKEENLLYVAKINELEQILHSLDEDRNKERDSLSSVKEDNILYVAKIKELELYINSLDLKILEEKETSNQLILQVEEYKSVISSQTEQWSNERECLETRFAMEESMVKSLSKEKERREGDMEKQRQEISNITISLKEKECALLDSVKKLETDDVVMIDKMVGSDSELCCDHLDMYNFLQQEKVVWENERIQLEEAQHAFGIPKPEMLEKYSETDSGDLNYLPHSQEVLERQVEADNMEVQDKSAETDNDKWSLKFESQISLLLAEKAMLQQQLEELRGIKSNCKEISTETENALVDYVEDRHSPLKAPEINVLQEETPRETLLDDSSCQETLISVMEPKIQAVVLENFNKAVQATGVEDCDSIVHSEDIASLRKQLADTLLILSALHDELHSSHNQRDNIVQELNQLKELEHFLEEEVVSLRDESGRLVQQVTSLEVDAENDAQHIGHLEFELREMENREKEIKVSIARFQDEQWRYSERLQKELDLQSRNLENQNTELSEHKTKVLGLEDELKAVSESCRVKDIHIEELEHEIARNLEKERDNEQEIERNLENKNTVLAEHKSKKLELEDELKAIIERCKVKDICIEELEQQVEMNLEKERKREQERENNLEKEKESEQERERNVENQNTDLAEHKNKVLLLEDELKAIAECCKGKDMHIQELEQEKEMWSKSVSELQERLVQSLNETPEIEKSIASLKLELDDKLQHVQHLENEVEYLKASGVELQDRLLSSVDSSCFEKLKKEMQCKEEHTKLVEAEVESLKEFVAAVQERQASEDSTIQKFQQELKDKLELIQNIESTISSLDQSLLETSSSDEEFVKKVNMEMEKNKEHIHKLEKELESVFSSISELQKCFSLSNTKQSTCESIQNNNIIQQQQEENETYKSLVVQLEEKIEMSNSEISALQNTQEYYKKFSVDLKRELQLLHAQLKKINSVQVPDNESVQQSTAETMQTPGKEVPISSNVDLSKSSVLGSNLQTALNELEQVELSEEIGNLRRVVLELTEKQMASPIISSPPSEKAIAGNQLRMDKLKVVAVKLKKELAESKKEITELKSEREGLLSQREELSQLSRQHLINFQSLQSENDHLQDKHESQRVEIVQFEQDLSRTVLELTTSKEQLAEAKQEIHQLKGNFENSQQEIKRVEAQRMELQSQVIVLRSDRGSDQKKTEGIRAETKRLTTRCSSLEKDLKSKEQHAKDLQAQLDQLKLELEQRKMLSLELGDYERSMSDLNAQLSLRDHALSELKVQLAEKESQMEGLLQQIGHLEHQCMCEEGRSAHLKETLELTRSRLEEKSQVETELTSTLTDLKQQKEDVVAAKEELQCQLAESSRRLSSLERELRVCREQSEKTVLALKSRIASLDEELISSHQQLQTSVEEFENYKVRVHSVLKQQKSSVSPTGQTSSSFSVFDQEQKEQLEWALELCKGKLAQMSEELGAISLERDSLHQEHERMLAKQALLIQQAQEKEESFLQKLQESALEINLNRSLWENEKQQLLHKQQNLSKEFEKCLSVKESEHERSVISLENQLDRLQKSAQTSDNGFQQQQVPRQQSLPHTYEWSPSSLRDSTIDETFDICNQERQEGEGSECADPTPTSFRSLVTVPASGFMPLERLLQSEPNSSAWTQDPEVLTVNINTLQKKVDHLAELLNESEASNLRLTEQTRLLKEEIRRLERNKERQEQEANLEYLKNVIIKFSTLPIGSEKERLVPVLTTLLKLSPEEQAQIMDVATQGDGKGGENATWGGYLHRWSGLV